jgi:hypothetical protein
VGVNAKLRIAAASDNQCFQVITIDHGWAEEKQVIKI